MGFIHKHRCGDCSRVWEHERLDTSKMAKDEGDRAYAASHTCPFCHSGPWYQAHFDTKADERAWDDNMDPGAKLIKAALLAFLLLSE